MDDLELVISAIWEALAKSGIAQDVDSLSLETGAEGVPVRTALSKLRDAKLVDVTQDSPRLYRARTIIDAIGWAQAVGLGVSIVALETYANLNEKTRAKALAMAARGEVERHVETQAAEKRQAREQIRRHRAKSQAAATELGRLVDVARRSLEDQRAQGRTDPATLILLELVVTESERSLTTLEKSLLRP